MFYALSWFVVVTLLALWSLAVAALHAVAGWAASSVEALSGAASGIGADWLTPWIPSGLELAMTQLFAGLESMINSLLQTTPALVGGLAVVAWVVWAIGSVLLLLMGVGLHRLITLWRRHGTGESGPRAAHRQTAR
ncbi:hypothetical protein ACEN2Y_00650 (plasmid) [Ralstonia solanacearum]|uniref:hypothetical protein n=1 Tax=Ralstonia solanacearum TaxID=305 RepID=UPI003217226B